MQLPAWSEVLLGNVTAAQLLKESLFLLFKSMVHYSAHST
jgi:hypothetical protein